MLRTFKASTAFAAIFAIGGCTAVLGISSDPHTAPSTDGGTTGDGGVGTCVGTLYVRIASDFSGTATDIAIPHFWGLYDYLRELNKNGGVRGCNIDIAVDDNNYTGPKTVEVVQKWRTTDPNWANVSTLFIFGTGPTTSAGPQIMQEQKVIIPGSYAGAFASPNPVQKNIAYKLVSDTYAVTDSSEAKTSAGWPFVFYPATDYGTGIRLGIQAAWKLAPGRISFAHDTPDKCAYCVEPLAAGKSFVENLPGMTIGRDLIIPQTSTDAATVQASTTKFIQDEIAHFKTANATSYTYDPTIWVWTGNSVFASAIMGKTIAEQQAIIDADPVITGILTTAKKPPWKIKVIANNWGIGETTPTICGAGCNGDMFYGLFPVPRFADLSNATAMAQLIATRDAWATADQQAIPPAPITARKQDAYRDVRYVQGYAAAAMWEEAVKKAVDAGSKNPTGVDIKNALEKFTAQDLGGLTAGPITFSPTDHRPQSNEVIYKVDANGNLAFVDRFSITLTNEWLGY